MFKPPLLPTHAQIDRWINWVRLCVSRHSNSVRYITYIWTVRNVCFDATRIRFTIFFSFALGVLAINYPYPFHHWFGSNFDAPIQRHMLCRSPVVLTKKRRRGCVKIEHLSVQRFPDVSRFGGAHFSGQNAKAIPIERRDFGSHTSEGKYSRGRFSRRFFPDIAFWQ